MFEDFGNSTRPVANYNLTGSGEPERLQGARATASVFSTLRVRPVIRWCLHRGQAARRRKGIERRRAELRRTAAAVRRRPVRGRADHSVEKLPPYQVVGVMSADFQIPMVIFDKLDVVEQHSVRSTQRTRGLQLPVCGTPEGWRDAREARAHMDVLAANLGRGYWYNDRGAGVFVEPMLSDMTGSVRQALLLLLAAVGSSVSDGSAQLGESPPGQGNEPSPGNLAPGILGRDAVTTGSTGSLPKRFR